MEHITKTREPQGEKNTHVPWHGIRVCGGLLVLLGCLAPPPSHKTTPNPQPPLSPSHTNTLTVCLSVCLSLSDSACYIVNPDRPDSSDLAENGNVTYLAPDDLIGSQHCQRRKPKHSLAVGVPANTKQQSAVHPYGTVERLFNGLLLSPLRLPIPTALSSRYFTGFSSMATYMLQPSHITLSERCVTGISSITT